VGAVFDSNNRIVGRKGRARSMKKMEQVNEAVTNQ